MNLSVQELLIRLLKRCNQDFIRKLMVLAMFYLHDEASAEDILYTAITKLLELDKQGKLDSFESEQEFFAFLYVMTKRLAISECRHRNCRYVGRTNHPDDDFTQIDFSPQGLDAFVYAEELEQFNAGFATLPKIDRDILTLRHVDGMYFKDIGSEVGYCSKTTSLHLRNATSQLHEMLPELLE